jgi:hypothetical protein
VDGHCKVHSGGGQVTLQVRHLRLERAFSRAAVWAASQAVASAAVAAMLALSAASLVDAAAARSFSTSTSTRASLVAKASRSIAAVAAAD